uniref:Uncharacterized protein n=1 Tax=Anguilla anguilla TaxID=7936 RepID=A0A0E9UWV9_ANGAN
MVFPSETFVSTGRTGLKAGCVALPRGGT